MPRLRLSVGLGEHGGLPVLKPLFLFGSQFTLGFCGCYPFRNETSKRLQSCQCCCDCACAHGAFRVVASASCLVAEMSSELTAARADLSRDAFSGVRAFW